MSSASGKKTAIYWGSSVNKSICSISCENRRAHIPDEGREGWGKKNEEDQVAISWRIRGGAFWPGDLKGELVLVPNFDEGYIAAVREEDWEGSPLERVLADLDSEIDDAEHDERGERLKRVRAASIFRGSLSKGKVAIPREIVWLLQRDNETQRDVTLVFVERVVEIWPTRRWQDYLAGHLFKRSD